MQDLIEIGFLEIHCVIVGLTLSLVLIKSGKLLLLLLLLLLILTVLINVRLILNRDILALSHLLVLIESRKSILIARHLLLLLLLLWLLLLLLLNTLIELLESLTSLTHI